MMASQEDMTRPPAPFVVGVGRSGTTLLRMMLDTHSQLAIPPETNFGPTRQAFARGGAGAVVDTVVDNGQWHDYGLSAEEFACRVESRNPADLGDVLRAFYELYAEQRGKPRWGDKSPYYLLGMTEIQRLLPEARFVHIVRDGRDVALSTVPVWFGAGDIAGAAGEWSRLLSEARRQAPELSFYIEIHYENLVCEPATTLKKLCEFLELEWEDAMLDYHHRAADRLASELGDAVVFGNTVPRRQRLDIHTLVGEPPRLDRVQRWRREMSASDLRAFERVAGEMLRTFGYEPS